MTTELDDFIFFMKFQASMNKRSRLFSIFFAPSIWRKFAGEAFMKKQNISPNKDGSYSYLGCKLIVTK